MRKLMIFALLIPALTASVSSFANPKAHAERGHDFPKNALHDGNLPEKRIKQHRWQVGYILPQHYCNDAYKIDYRQDSQLSKPTRNQQWYRVNHEDILVDTENRQIIKIERK